MSRKSMVSMIGGTVISALAIGFFMQRGETAAPRTLVPPMATPIRQVVLEPAVSMAPVALMAADVANQPDMQNLVLASAVAPKMITPSLPEAAVGVSTPVAAPVDGGPVDGGPVDGGFVPTDPAVPNLGCDVVARATVAPLAMVDLEISAPCFRNERVTIHHNGMMFTQATDEAGKLSVSVPALGQSAVFMVALGDGKGAVVLADVPDLSGVERVVVQWTGSAGFQIHALEFGATYGDPGHVWSGKAAEKQQGVGFVTRLGDPDTLIPQMAEIYTFPSGTSPMSGVVALSVEAEVTGNNCGRDITAQSLELRGGSTLRTRDLVMAMPNCAALGDFLVLNNLVDDLKIAAR